MHGWMQEAHRALVPSSKYPAAAHAQVDMVLTGLDVLQEVHTVRDVQLMHGCAQATH